MRKLLIAAAALMLPATAFAGGYAIPNTNARDLGMVESIVADQQGPEAVYGNQAALAGLNGLSVTAGAQLIYFRSTWTDSTGFTGATGGTTPMVDKIVVPPELFVAYGGKVAGMAYGIGGGFTVPGGGFVFWPDQWAGRGKVISVDRKVYNVHLAGGIELVKGLKVGLGGVLFRSTEHLIQGVDAGPQAQIEVATAGGTLSWTGGIEFKPSESVPVKFGLEYRHQAVQNLTGQAHAGHIPPALVAAGGLFDQGISHSLTFPNVLQIGVAVNPLPNLLIAAAFQLSRFTVYQQDAFIGDRGTTVLVAREFHNQQVYRLGAELGVLPGLKIRAGILRDVSPQPTDTIDPSLPDSSDWATSIGGSFDVGKTLGIGLAWEHAFFDQVQTTGIRAFPGQYNSKADLFAVNLTWRMQ